LLFDLVDRLTSLGVSAGRPVLGSGDSTTDSRRLPLVLSPFRRGHASHSFVVLAP
jgi:hypothetical protein